MAEVEIKIKGAASTFHKVQWLQESRLLSGFPDGCSRIVTLSGWHWQIFDFLESLPGWRYPPGRFEADIYKLAEHFWEQGQTFEAELARSARGLIMASFSRYNHEQKLPANENGPLNAE